MAFVGLLDMFFILDSTGFTDFGLVDEEKKLSHWSYGSKLIYCLEFNIDFNVHPV